MEVNALKLEYPAYDPMSNDEISACIKSLKSLFPIASDFGSPEPAETVGAALQDRLFHIKRIYRPATDEKISKYTDQDYPEWMKKCEEVLSCLHELLQQEIGQPSFALAVVNEGTRPGRDALVNIVAKGNFKIRPPRTDDCDSPEKKNLVLPHVPQPPRGRWIRLNPLENRFTGIANLARRVANPYDFRTYPSTAIPRIDPVRPRPERLLLQTRAAVNSTRIHQL